MFSDAEDPKSAENREGKTIVRKAGLDDLAARFDPIKIYRGTLRRLWLVVILAILFALGFGFLGHHLKGVYVAEAYIMYEASNDRNLPEGFPIAHFTMAAAVEMVTLPTHLNAVRSILNLDLTERQLAGMIDVKPPMGDSNLINITVSADNPSLAVDIANTLASVVVKDAQDFTKRQLRSAYDYLSAQAQRSRDKIDQTMSELAAFRLKHPYLEVTREGVVIVTRGIQEAEKNYQEAVTNYNSLLIQFETIKREAAQLPDQVVRSAVLDSPLRRRLSQIELALLEARSRYAQENPKVKILEAQVHELNAMLAKASTESPDEGGAFQQFERNPVKEQLNLDMLVLLSKVRSAQKIKEDLAENLAKEKVRMATLPADELEFGRLLNQKARYEEELKQTDAVMKVASMMLKLGKGDISLYTNAAQAPLEKSFIIDMLPLIGFLVGTGFGLSLAAFFEVLDNKLRTPQEVERSYNLPCLVTIPEMSLSNKRVGEEKLKFYISHLEGVLSRFEPQDARFSLAITSSISGEGKSTLVYCLAHYWQKMGKKVVVIDLDGASNIFWRDVPKPKKPLEDYLRGSATLEEVVADGQVPRLQIGQDQDVNVMLRTGHVDRLLQILRETYDILLFDVPGIIEQDYSITALELAEHTVFVVGSNKVARKYVDASLHELEVANLWPLGIILNRALKIFIDDVHVASKRSSSGVFSRIFSRKA